MKIYKVFDSVFECEYCLYTGISFDRFKREISKYKQDISQLDYADDCKGLTTTVDSGGVCIYIKEFDMTPEKIAILVHECVHATQQRLYLDCNVDRREMECPAYYAAFLVREFLTKMTKPEKQSHGK